ncbi:hypothetical protein DFH08DRAFT_855995 [Mycena albidolilacea]|uniref:Uncharacterized protein n=1 Tax=Mycena albidolilacea TaxID=1033008 RepID=A0AAD7EUP4_9AGAR|nr:hypothetical protein DFH08DRAFT_855995 [Mycena albidolilacea]
MVLFIAALPLLALLVGATPYSSRDASFWRRQNDTTEPQFPASPASCGVCSQNYDSIKLCISVIPVVANFTTVIDNPGSFVNVLTCGCSDTFNTTFPECVDCFENTNQQAVLNMDDPDAVLTGLTKVCAFERALGIHNSAPVNSMPLFTLGLGAVALVLGTVWW